MRNLSVALGKYLPGTCFISLATLVRTYAKTLINPPAKTRYVDGMAIGEPLISIQRYSL
jgi:hypothetical protein